MTPAPSPAIDPHSFAQGPALPHLTLALAINFASQTLAGSATWQLATPPAEPTEVVFDTRDLVIERVWANAEGTGPEAAHTLGTPDATLGQALRIALPAGTAAVRIAYRTSPHAAALQMAGPGADGRRTPVSIHAVAGHSGAHLAALPRLTGPSLHLRGRGGNIGGRERAIAGPDECREPAGHCSRRALPLPAAAAYLLALAAGRLDFAPLSGRTGIYAEPATLPRATHGFGELDSMVQAA